MSGFSFTSSVVPNHISYRAYALDAAQQSGADNLGDLYPKPLPEPSSLLSLGMGMLGVALVRRRR